MTQSTTVFQPGSILHESIVGAFRAKGMNLNLWCTENGVGFQAARQVTFGLMRGVKGNALLAEMIEAAGIDTVAMTYRFRMRDEAAKLEQSSAQVAA
jgi:hypothetical protein